MCKYKLGGRYRGNAGTAALGWDQGRTGGVLASHLQRDLCYPDAENFSQELAEGRVGFSLCLGGGGRARAGSEHGGTKPFAIKLLTTAGRES